MIGQAVPFSQVQRGVLRIWRARHPLGLGVRILPSAGSGAERAEVFHRDAPDPLCSLHAFSDGRILINGAAGIWSVSSLETALERVVELGRMRCDVMSGSPLAPMLSQVERRS
jgi:hypothetical protein